MRSAAEPAFETLESRLPSAFPGAIHHAVRAAAAGRLQQLVGAAA